MTMTVNILTVYSHLDCSGLGIDSVFFSSSVFRCPLATTTQNSLISRSVLELSQWHFEEYASNLCPGLSTLISELGFARPGSEDVFLVT